MVYPGLNSSEVEDTTELIRRMIYRKITLRGDFCSKIRSAMLDVLIFSPPENEKVEVKIPTETRRTLSEWTRATKKLRDKTESLTMLTFWEFWAKTSWLNRQKSLLLIGSIFRFLPTQFETRI